MFCTQIIVVRQIQGFIQSGLVIAGIINRSCNRLVGELVRLDEVESAYLSRVLAQFACHQVYGPLCDVGRLWTSRPTISIRGNFIREDDIATEVYVGNIIGATSHREAKGNHNHIGEELRIRAHVRDAINLQAGYLTIPGRSDLDIVNLVASMDGHRQIFTAVLNPFNGMPCLHGSKSRHNFFGVDIELGPKTTTNFGYDDTHLMLG